MFQSAGKRLRSLFSLADDLLGHSPESEWLGSPPESEGLSDPPESEGLSDPPESEAPHPHRRPLRFAPERRRGSVAARPAHCLSPVRSPAERPRHGQLR